MAGFTALRSSEVIFLLNRPTPQRTPVLDALHASGLRVGVVYVAGVRSPSRGWGDIELEHPSANLGSRLDLLRMLRVLLAPQVKILCVFGYRGLPFVIAAATARVRRLQLVTRSDSNAGSLAHESAVKRQVRRMVMRVIFPRSVRVWTIGDANEEYWRSYVRRENTLRIPYSVPRPPGHPQISPQPRRSDPASLKFLYVGRLSREKRVDDLIRAFRHVAHDNWSLTIVGEGPERQSLESGAAGDTRVKFLGAVPYDDLAAVYSRADVLVLPSGYEPWGLVVNEAQAFGLRVIASDAVGAIESLEEGDEVYPVGDVQSLKSALEASAEFCSRRPKPVTDPTPLMLKDLRAMLRERDHAR